MSRYDPSDENPWQGFDDISFDKIHVKGFYGTLIRVRYGVGGGNGGYMTFLVPTKDGEDVVLVSHTFDRDLLSCSKEFIKNS